MVPHFADRLSVLAALLAAIMHDYEHMGLTNDFLINCSSVLAIRYNDRAPLVSVCAHSEKEGGKERGRVWPV
jgi:hypothetical protein